MFFPPCCLLWLSQIQVILLSQLPIQQGLEVYTNTLGPAELLLTVYHIQSLLPTKAPKWRELAFLTMALSHFTLHP